MMRLDAFGIRALVIAALLLSCLASDEKCTTGTTFFCPNCGGIEVNDCFDCIGYFSPDTRHNMCINRKLFQPRNVDTNDFETHYHYLWNDLVGMVIWFLTAGMAVACGVGGGGVYVPLGVSLLRFAPKQASGLSQASIFGASLGGLFLNLRCHHPNKKIRSDPGVPNDEGRVLQEKASPAREEEYLRQGNTFYSRPVINYDMALFLAPMQMAGAVLGVLVQMMLPNWLYLLIAGIVLSFTCYQTYTKFFQIHKKEMKHEAKQATFGEREQEEESLEPTTDSMSDELVESEHVCAVDDELIPLSGHAEEHIAVEGSPLKQQQEQAIDYQTMSKDSITEEVELRKKYLEEDMHQYPRNKIIALLVLWIGLFFITLFKGGKGVDSIVGIQCNSPWYIVLIVLQFVWLGGFAMFFGYVLLRKQNEREKVRYPYLHDDPVWDKKSLRFYGSFTFVAGIVAGLIGIGGGMVLGPLMLVMNVDPRVSSATNATMIVLISSSVSVIFVISGLVPWSYAIFYFFVCLAGALFGKSRIDKYIQRTGRASILVFILASIIGLAAIGCFIIIFTHLASKNWCLDGFNKFCTVKHEEACGPLNPLLKMGGT
jgi:uncharacterized membrane protein YfcA